MATARNPVTILKQLSRQSSEGFGEEISFQDELELLQNVYCDELEIVSLNKPSRTLSFHITPSTGDDKDKQFVYTQVTVAVDSKYPSSKPSVSIVKSRGLSDSHLHSISLGVGELAAERLGIPMIYDLIEYIRECLTNNNRPYGKCVLCQYDFQDGEDFVRTECYHYFHSWCILNYDQYCKTTLEEDFDQIRMKQRLTKKKLECPVCRIPLDSESLNLSGNDSLLDWNVLDTENNSAGVFKPSKHLLDWQEQMSVLYQKQLAKGGIITGDSDDVIDETWVSSRSLTSEQVIPNNSSMTNEESLTNQEIINSSSTIGFHNDGGESAVNEEESKQVLKVETATEKMVVPNSNDHGKNRRDGRNEKYTNRQQQPQKRGGVGGGARIGEEGKGRNGRGYGDKGSREKRRDRNGQRTTRHDDVVIIVHDKHKKETRSTTVATAHGSQNTSNNYNRRNNGQQRQSSHRNNKSYSHDGNSRPVDNDVGARQQRVIENKDTISGTKKYCCTDSEETKHQS